MTFKQARLAQHSSMVFGTSQSPMKPSTGSRKRSRSPTFDGLSLDGDSGSAKEHKRTRKGRSLTPATDRQDTGSTEPSRTDVEGTDQQEQDDDGKVAPYKPSLQERLPQLPVYHPNFGAAEKLVTQICDTLCKEHNELTSRGFVNMEIERIFNGDHNSIKSLRIPASHYSPSKTVALYGNSGGGKSSTANSGLGFKKAAFENSSNRGTYVPTEFRASGNFQSAPWEVRVLFYSREQSSLLVQQHVNNILEFINRDDDIDQEEVEDMHTRHTAAVEFFCWLFGDKSDFSDAAKCAQYFAARNDEDGQEDEIVQDVMTMIDDFLASRDLQDGTEIHTAQDENSLAKIVKDIARPSKRGAGAGVSPWPLMEKVEVRTEHDLLSKGLIIADLAGTGDTCAMLVENTRRYINSADAILVFANHLRIESNSALDAQLRMFVNAGKSGDIFLIVTCIDSHDVYKDGERDELSNSELSLLKAAELEVENNLDEQKHLRSERRTASLPRKLEIMERLELLENEHAKATARVRQVSIEIRCRSIKKEMADRLQKLERNRNAPELPILFVSNTAYQTHVDGFLKTKRPVLDVEGSGIPALRHYLYKLAAGTKFHTLKRICRTLLPHMVSGALGVLTKSKLERLGDGRIAVDQLIKRRTVIVESVHQDVTRHYGTHIAEAMVKGDAKYKQKAKELVQSWQHDYKAITFMAFCRKSGTHRPAGKSEDISLNQAIQDTFDDDLNTAFSALEDEMRFLSTVTVSDAKAYFNDMVESLEGCDAFQGVDISELLDSIRRIRDDLQTSLMRHCGGLKTAINQVRTLMLRDTENSLCAAAMQDTYKAVMLMQGLNYEKTNKKGKVIKVMVKSKEAHKLRIERVHNKLQGDGDQIDIFTDITNRTKAELDEKMGDWVEEAKRLVDEGCQRIKEDFEHRYGGAENVKEEVDPEAVETLKKAAGKALATIEGTLKELIEVCEVSGSES